MTNLLTVEEVAKRLGLKKSTIYKYTSARKIPFVKLASSVRIKESDLERWVDEQRIVPISES